MVKSVSNYLRT